MKNIAGIFAYSTEENFKNEGRPDKWIDLAESTKKQREKKGHWPGQILQVTGQLAASINTYYDNDSAVIGSNLDYAAIHQLGGQAGKNKSVDIPARPYILLQKLAMAGTKLTRRVIIQMLSKYMVAPKTIKILRPHGTNKDLCWKTTQAAQYTTV